MQGQTVKTLIALTSSEIFHTLADADQDLAGVVPDIVSLTQAVLNHPQPPQSSATTP